VIEGFDLKSSSGVPGYIPEGKDRLLDYESRRPVYFKNIAQARGFYLGKILLTKKPSWSGIVCLNSAECAWHLMMYAPEEICISEKLVNPYKAVLSAMSCVSGFFNTGDVTYGKMKRRNGMRYIELNRK